ncbi:MAG: DUF4139 domain-containing protein [Planctomycetes bacterium]|nr:DUF4139 domain-containing protein [Planctomycetota bacterium]
MKKTIITTIAILLCSSLCCCAISQVKQSPGTALTIYNDNFAVIRNIRNMDFKKGVNTIKFTDVPSTIDATSVKFQCLSSPGAISILEQNYEYDLLNTQSLLNRYIDKKVSISVKGAGADVGTKITGILSASKDGNLIIQEDAGLKIISYNSVESIDLAEKPEDLVTKPTLVWLADSQKQGSQLCMATFTASGISWKADYTAILNADENALDFSGWVTINNQSGAGYKDAVIKLIAGDVRRVQPEQPRMYRQEVMMAKADAAGAGFEEKSFMEYHMYTLGRKSTVNNRQTKQIEFIVPALNVPVEKLYIYDHKKMPKKMQVKLEFENKKEYGLGIAMPKGKIRVFKKDPADDMLEFVGEDMIDHTPRKEKLSLYIGNAFDIVPEYKTTDTKRSRRRVVKSHEVEIRNRKDTPITVFVDENFSSWRNWSISNNSHKFEKKDAATARFKVKIEADSTVTITYTTTETW